MNAEQSVTTRHPTAHRARLGVAPTAVGDGPVLSIRMRTSALLHCGRDAASPISNAEGRFV